MGHALPSVGIAETGVRFRAAGLVSIMLDTQRKDLMRAISNAVTSADDRGKAYEPYLLDPGLLVAAPLPPLFLVTSAEDLIQKDTLKLDGLLTASGVEHELLNFPKGDWLNLDDADQGFSSGSID